MMLAEKKKSRMPYNLKFVKINREKEKKSIVKKQKNIPSYLQTEKV